MNQEINSLVLGHRAEGLEPKSARGLQDSVNVPLTQGRAMTNRRKFAPKVFVPLFIASMGLAAFSNMASSPRFATFQTIDVVR